MQKHNANDLLTLTLKVSVDMGLRPLAPAFPCLPGALTTHTRSIQATVPGHRGIQCQHPAN